MIGKYQRKNTATRQAQVHLGSNILSYLVTYKTELTNQGNVGWNVLVPPALS